VQLKKDILLKLLKPYPFVKIYSASALKMEKMIGNSTNGEMFMSNMDGTKSKEKLDNKIISREKNQLKPSGLKKAYFLTRGHKNGLNSLK
jgi:hypothetical protein